MKQPLYLLKSGTLKRKDNTLLFIPADGSTERKYIPVEQVSAVYAFGSLELNSALVNFLAQHNVPVHFFNYYGTYTASIYPREQDVSGLVVLRQAEHFLDKAKRLVIAKEMIDGTLTNMIRVLRYYANRKNTDALNKSLQTIEELYKKIPHAQSVDELRGIEGKARNSYFDVWNEIIDPNTGFIFSSRTRRPPADPLNALISFGNSLLYSTVVGEILNVHLHGGISYVHEPGRYRFSLALDIADIFKPVFVDRLIFKLINKQIIQPRDFVSESNYTILTDKGRRTFLTHWEETMKRTVKHLTLKRNVSMRHLIRLECYKLIKHLLDDKPYKSFKIWWQ